MTVLALMPGGDYASDEVARWGREALNDRACQILRGEEVKLATIQVLLEASSFERVCYFGHGHEAAWAVYRQVTGRSGPETVFAWTVLAATDARIFSGTVVVAIACLSGQALGPALISAGAQAFVGFTKKISWRADLVASGKALGNCIRQLVRHCLDTPTARLDRAGLYAIIDRHWNYWRDLKWRGDREAPVAFSCLENLRQILAKLPEEA